MKRLARSCSLFILVASLVSCDRTATGPEVPTAIPVSAGQGILVGELAPDSVLVQVRLTQGETLLERDLPGMPGVVEFTLYRFTGDTRELVSVQAVDAEADFDFIARAHFTELEPGAAYVCTTLIGPDVENLVDGPTAYFHTLPGPDRDDPVRFVVVTGMNYAKFHGDNRIDRAQHLVENNTELPRPYDGSDKSLGYPALAAILALQPDFFVGTGDNVYYDTPDNPRAETVPELRQKWHEQFVQPRYRDLFARVPTYWMIDDHDYRIDDGDNSGDYLPTPETGRRMMLEQLPVAPMEDIDEALTYRTHRASRDLQLWFPENRIHRSDNALPDGPEKTIWGEAQKAWLKRTLRESDATFKVLVSPTPMIGPDDLRKTDNHTNHGGFRHERDEFFAWLKETGLDQDGFYLVCGDRHWQYHSVHPTGIEEFSSGALIDANSRLGRKPGDPKSTDPEGLIQQPYTQDPRSGGFLLIESRPGNLAFTWHDEQGKVLHQTNKVAP